MDEQLKAKLIGYLESVEAKVKAGSDFVATETPELVREWLRWVFLENCIISAGLLILTVICSLIVRRLIRYWRTYDGFDEPPIIVGIMFVSLAALGCSIGSVNFGLKAVKVYYAPRVVVVEKVAELTGLAKAKQ